MTHSNDQHQTPIQVMFFGLRENGDEEDEIHFRVSKLILESNWP
jgi:hypothetical protein